MCVCVHTKIMKNGTHLVEHVKLQLLSTWIMMCDEVIDRLFILLFIKIKTDRHVMNGNIKMLTQAHSPKSRTEINQIW